MSTFKYLSNFEDAFDSIYVICEDTIDNVSLDNLLHEKLGIDNQPATKHFCSKETTQLQSLVACKGDLVAFGISKICSKKSRNMPCLRTDLVESSINKLKALSIDSSSIIVVSILNKNQVLPFVTTFRQSFPKFTRKTNNINKSYKLALLDKSLEFHDQDLVNKAMVVEKNVSLAAELVDTPCSDLHVDEYIRRITNVYENLKAFAKEKGTGEVGLKVIQDKQLLDEKLVGIYTVGMAAVNKPALVILSYEPKTPEDPKITALVGKGICYDTGGLSIKSGMNMISMKGDMGGSAAVLGAFSSLVQLCSKKRIYSLMCLAENAVDQLSVRPDDIIEMHSGKSVEINNTDAEGRLVLGDGVSYASSVLKADTIIDIATLTGAQLMCTGNFSGALVCNDPEFERFVVDCGKSSGDMVFPILYCPELIMKDIKSEVADMKNSAKGKVTAMSSLAAHFIEAHISPDFTGKWAHLDIAGPSFRKERATGFGVSILVEILLNK